MNTRKEQLFQITSICDVHTPLRSGKFYIYAQRPTLKP